MLHVPGLFIGNSEGRGRGVFTAEALSKGDLIEICPLLIVPKAEVAAIHQTILHDYYFLWPDDEGSACIALGYGSIYNHDERFNAEVRFDLANKSIEFYSTAIINAGSEIYINYNGNDAENRLWFNPVGSR